MPEKEKSFIEEEAKMERRQFFKVSAKYGFTTAVVAAAGSSLMSGNAVAQTAKEEKERRKNAKYTMTLATAYIIGASRSYPIMQLDFKENVQNMTNGQVYVKLAPGGQLGAGGALAQKVQQGTIQVAQHSLSNFAPFAPVVDLINLPYFCGANQKFINLVTSDVWQKEVNPKVESKGFMPLWYVVIDPRVVAVRKGGKGPIKTLMTLPELSSGFRDRKCCSNIIGCLEQTRHLWHGVKHLRPSSRGLLMHSILQPEHFMSSDSKIFYPGSPLPERYRILRFIPVTWNGSRVFPVMFRMESSLPVK